MPRLVSRVLSEIVPHVEADVAYQAVSEADRRTVVEAAVELAIDALAEGRGPSPAELELIAAVGEQRARQGVSNESIIATVRAGALGAVRAGALGAVEEMEDLARREQMSAMVTMDLVRSLWRWTDEVVAALVAAQRRVELEELGRTYEQRSAFLHAAVLGKLDRVQLQHGARAIGLPAQGPVRAARVRPPVDEVGEVGEVGEVMAQLPHSALHGCVTAVLGSDVVALVIGEPPVLRVPGGLGPAVPVVDIPTSFEAASLAVDAASAFGMTGWHTLDEVATRVAVLANDEVGDVLVRRVLGALEREGPFGEELVATLQEWWAQGQSVPALRLPCAYIPTRCATGWHGSRS